MIFFEIISFPTVDGQIRQIALRASHARKPGKLIDALRDAGAALDDDNPKVVADINRLIASKPACQGEIVTIGGWYGEPGHLFVFRNQRIRVRRKNKSATTEASLHPVSRIFPCLTFNIKEAVNLIGREALRDDIEGVFHVRGTVRSWNFRVARLARYSSRAMLCISAALAGPVLGLLGLQPFAILLTGPTSAGKSSATLAAASVIGIRAELELADWHLTPSRLEELARRHNDLLLPIDDLAKADGDDQAQFKLLRTVAYRLSGGARRGRLGTVTATITGRPGSQTGMRTIVLSSSEQSISDLARMARQRLQGGVEVRFIDVPAVSPGSYGIWDGLSELPSKLDPIAFAKSLSERMARGAASRHGQVLKAWLKKLVSRPEYAKQQILAGMARFLAAVGAEAADAKGRRHADRFAVIFGASAFAIECGILNWTEEELLDAIISCYRASKAELRDDRDELAAGLRILASRLNDETKIVDWFKPRQSSQRSSGVEGWRRLKGKDETFYVRGEAFRQWFEIDLTAAACGKSLARDQPHDHRAKWQPDPAAADPWPVGAAAGLCPPVRSQPGPAETAHRRLGRHL